MRIFKNKIKIVKGLLIVLPMVIITGYIVAQEMAEEIVAEATVEPKPVVFYDFDKYQPLEIPDEYIIDNGLLWDIEQNVVKNIFAIPEKYLREPVSVNLIDLRKSYIEIKPTSVVLSAGKNAKKWRCVIFDTKGSPFREIRGKGRIPRIVKWNGLGDDGSLLKVGEIYQPQFFVTDRDGKTRRITVHPIDLNGVITDTIIRVKRENILTADRITREGQNILKFVTNWMKENRASSIQIRMGGSNYYILEDIKKRITTVIPGIEIEIKPILDRYAKYIDFEIEITEED